MKTSTLRRSLVIASSGQSAVANDWSHDGGRILFTINHVDGLSEVGLVSRLGGRMTVLTPAATGGGHNATFSPDGLRISYVRTADWSLMTTTVLGLTRPRMLIAAPTYSASWSPTVNQILFVGPRGVGVVNANGANTHYIACCDNASATWSPDGKHIAIVDPGLAMQTVDPSGDNAQSVGGSFGARTGVDYSPDGRFIVFNKWVRIGSDPTAIRSELFVIPAGGGVPRALAPWAYGDRDYPTWAAA